MAHTHTHTLMLPAEMDGGVSSAAPRGEARGHSTSAAQSLSPQRPVRERLSAVSLSVGLHSSACDADRWKPIREL